MALVGGITRASMKGGATSNAKQKESGYSSTYEGNRGPGEGRAAHQPRHSRRSSPTYRRRGDKSRCHQSVRRPAARRRGLARSGRNRPQRTPAGLQDPRFREVSLPRAEEVVRSAQAPEGGRGQGDQAPARNRRPRLRSEDALGAPVLRRGRQGQGDAAFSRPRNGAPGYRIQASAAGQGRNGANRQGRGRAVDGRPPDDHGARAEVARVTPF